MPENIRQGDAVVAGTPDIIWAEAGPKVTKTRFGIPRDDDRDCRVAEPKET